MNITISTQELQSHGCIACIWRIHNQCPHDIKIGEKYIQAPTKPGETELNGICNEYINFLLSLATEDDSINSLWEKFSLYVARLQSLDDYQEYISFSSNLKKKLKSMEPSEKFNAELKLNTLRLWWERLNDTVRKGYGKIADREGRLKEGKSIPGIMNAKTINFNISNEKKEELEMKK